MGIDTDATSTVVADLTFSFAAGDSGIGHIQRAAELIGNIDCNLGIVPVTAAAGDRAVGDRHFGSAMQTDSGTAG